MTNPTTVLPTPGLLPQEEDTRRAHRADEYDALLARLCRISVAKHYDAYVDVPWDDPDYAIDPEDPCWILHDFNTLGETDWYRARPQALQARIGLHVFVASAKIGLQFENVLTRGLLEFALNLPNGAREFRYAYHEAIEESQHSLIFQEFVNRSGLEVEGLSPRILRLSRRVATLGRRFPELFFLFVLGGEDPIDHQQRVAILQGSHERHPLLRRISQIHVTEEARHISFARAYLRRHVPALSRGRTLRLRLLAPILLAVMSRLMLEVPGSVVREYGIPRAALRQAYRGNRRHRANVQAALGKVTQLCDELGLVRWPFDRLWYGGGIARRPAA